METLYQFPADWDLFILNLRDSAGREVLLGQVDMLVTETMENEDRHIISFISKENDLSVKLTTYSKTPELRMHLDVENGSGLELVSLDFPRLSVTGITPEHALYMASPWGSRNYDPIKLLREDYGGAASRRYPADLAMQYTLITGDNKVHYLSAYSLSDEIFEAWAEVTGDDSICLFSRWFPYLKDGSWSSPENGVALLEGTWHVGADIYRETMSRHFSPPEHPQWMNDTFHGWLQVGLKFEDEEPKYRFKDIPDLYRKAAEVGLNVLHVYGWAGRGHDTLYPEFDVNTELGTEEELRTAMDEVKSMGGHVMLYTNGRIIDPGSEFYKNGGSNEVIVNEDGSEPEEWYCNSVRFKVACPSSSAYHGYFLAQFHKMLTRLHHHGMQIDQISCNPSYLCFNKEHDHSKPSINWIPGIESLLSEVRKLHQSLDPEFFIWVEGVNERFGQFYDINQGNDPTVPWTIGLPYQEQFKYTYPDYIVTGPGGTIDKLCHAFIQGKPLDFHVESLNDERFKRLASDFIMARKCERAYFLDGRFMDTVGFTIHGHSGVEARAIKRRDGRGLMVNFWTPGTEDDTRSVVTVSIDAITGAPRPVYPSDAVVSESGGCYTISWAGPAACVVWE